MSPEDPRYQNFKRLHPTTKKIYVEIRRSLESLLFAPSVVELAELAGLSSRATAHRHLKTLEERGFIRRRKGVPRAIEIIPRTIEPLEDGLWNDIVEIKNRLIAAVNSHKWEDVKRYSKELLDASEEALEQSQEVA